MAKAPSRVGDSGEAIARKYEKMSPREHVLRRPDTYIGSIGVVEETHLVVDDGRIKSINMEYTPGLAKIFDECLVNAMDHVVRLTETGGPNSMPVTEIRVTIDANTGVLSVFNDGDGLDVVEHPVHKMYVPQLVFGELLTSSNYDDEGQEKLWGGRNGYGAKLANIWSLWFEVETFDRTRGLMYRQKFEKNMGVIGAPKIRSKTTGKPFTHITFLPDYARMHLDGLSKNMASLLARRVYDAAAVTPSSVTVRLNGEKIPVKTFKDYVTLFDCDGPVATFRARDGRWDIALTTSVSGSFEQVSFVNGICTRKGGTHVNFVSNLIAKTMASTSNKKGGSPIKVGYIKDNMRLFLRCVVPNPTFSSQTKEELTSPSSKFSSSLDLKTTDVAKLAKGSGIMERAEALMEFHENRKIKASGGKKQARLFISKLDDANNAGTKKSSRCTLILTEGDSAKTMAISGLSVVGRDDYGVFPLRGKLLNITDKSVATALKNEEVANIVKILGLKPGQTNSINDLRYGRVMIMADADDDGIHIRALTINLFRVLFPNLFRTEGFLVSMMTPVVKARTSKETFSFYSLSEYRSWQAKHPKSSPVVKYLKGLGSSTSAEAKDYFRDMRLVEYQYTSDSDDRMSLAFSKTRADDRKKWLMSYSDSSTPPDFTRTKLD
jgi:DNA topoisomerase II